MSPAACLLPEGLECGVGGGGGREAGSGEQFAPMPSLPTPAAIPKAAALEEEGSQRQASDLRATGHWAEHQSGGQGTHLGTQSWKGSGREKGSVAPGSRRAPLVPHEVRDGH